MSEGGGPQVTVLICTYNDEGTIAAAVESALAQTAGPGVMRVLAVDDGSTDGTPAVLGGFAGAVEVVHNTRNVGLVPSCNIGLGLIETPFFVRLDGDDRFEPELVEELLAAASARGANVVYSDRVEVGPGGARVERRMEDPVDVGHLIASGVLLPTELVRRIGGYRELFWEEYDLFMRLLESGECTTAHVPRPLYAYTVGAPGAMTSDAAKLAAGWAELRELWPREVLERYGLAGHAGGVPGRAR